MNDALFTFWGMGITPVKLFGFATFIFGIFCLVLKDEKDQIRIFLWISDGPSIHYSNMLNKISGIFDDFFGRELLSWRSFDRCASLAFTYILFSLGIIVWSFSSQIPEKEISVFATGAITSIICLPISYHLSGRYEQWILARCRNIRFLFYKIALKYLGYLLFGLVAGITFFLLTLVTMGVTGEMAQGFAEGAIIGILYGSFMGIILKGGTITFSVFISPLVLACTFIYFRDAPVGGYADDVNNAARAGTMLIVGLLLTKATFDWFSWAASRWLTRRLAADARKGAWLAICGHFAMDLVLTFLFLIALAISIACLFSLVTQDLSSQTLSNLDFQIFSADPLGKGLWITVMMVSTLFPTFFHLSAAFLALIFLPPPLRKLPLKYLDTKDPSTAERWLIAGYITVWISVAIAASAILLLSILYVFEFHGQSLWDAIFIVAGYLVIN
jgi:hypothetical protein